MAGAPTDLLVQDRVQTVVMPELSASDGDRHSISEGSYTPLSASGKAARSAFDSATFRFMVSGESFPAEPRLLVL